MFLCRARLPMIIVMSTCWKNQNWTADVQLQVPLVEVSATSNRDDYSQSACFASCMHTSLRLLLVRRLLRNGKPRALALGPHGAPPVLPPARGPALRELLRRELLHGVRPRAAPHCELGLTGKSERLGERVRIRRRVGRVEAWRAG